MNLATLPEIYAAFKRTLEPLGCQVYDQVPDAPNAPCIMVYPGPIQYDETQPMEVIIWCLAGNGETKGTQAQLLTWLDTGPGSIVELIDADSQLGGAVSSVIPIEVRKWGTVFVSEGRSRYWQAELVCDVLP